MKDRGSRITETRRVIRKRLLDSKWKNSWMHKRDFVRQPHRMHKQKLKFTSNRASLKEDKAIESGKERAQVKNALKTGRDIKPVSRNSVKWSYW